MTERLCTRERPTPVVRGRDLDVAVVAAMPTLATSPGRRTNYEIPT
jgi:hypothetical protein